MRELADLLGELLVFPSTNRGRIRPALSAKTQLCLYSFRSENLTVSITVALWPKTALGATSSSIMSA